MYVPQPRIMLSASYFSQWSSLRPAGKNQDHHFLSTSFPTQCSRIIMPFDII